MPVAEKGLTAHVYMNPLGDCSNGGLSARVKRVTIVGVSTDWTGHAAPSAEPVPAECQVSAPRDDAPAVVLVVRDNGDVRWTSIQPVEPPPADQTPYMSGGNYVASCDSRFTALVGHDGAVRLHDRTETWAQYDALSR